MHPRTLIATIVSVALLAPAAPAAASSSIEDRLTEPPTSVEITSEPAGAAYTHVAIMETMAGAGIRYLNIPLSQTTYTPPADHPVVDMQAFFSNNTPDGGWAGRKQAGPPVEPISIAAKLSADKTSVEVTAEPAGTAYIHVAVMRNLAAEGISYLNLPSSQTTYTPPAGQPVVDLQARSSSGAAIGSWAGRIQTTPTEQPKEEPPPSSMIVGVDSGGWAWEGAVADFSGAVKYIRSDYGNYNSPSQVALLQKYGVHLMPLFTGWSAPAQIVPWFRAYGKAAGATTAEVVNEPGNPFFWGAGAQTDQARYAAVIEAAATAIKQLPASERPRLLVSFDGGFEGDAYGRALVKADPNLLNLGLGWTVHPYGGHVPREQSARGNRARVTEAHQDTGQRVYVTEVGWPTCGETGDSLNWSQSEQAANITSFTSWAAGLGYVSAVVSFNYADYAGNCYGIVDGSGTTHKLSYAALASAAARW